MTTNTEHLYHTAVKLMASCHVLDPIINTAFPNPHYVMSKSHNKNTLYKATDCNTLQL